MLSQGSRLNTIHQVKLSTDEEGDREYREIIVKKITFISVISRIIFHKISEFDSWFLRSHNYKIKITYG